METFETTVKIKIRVKAKDRADASGYIQCFMEEALFLLGQEGFVAHDSLGDAELDLTGPKAQISVTHSKQVSGLENLTHAITVFKLLCADYRDLGAEDTEVQTHIAEVITAALDKQPFPAQFSKESNPWELFDLPMRDHATQVLTTQAKKIHGMVKPEFGLACPEIFWLKNSKN